MLRAAVLALLALLCGRPALADAVPDDIGRRVAEGFARPAAAAFAKAAGAASRQVEELCAAPDAAGLEAARAAFPELVSAWGRLSLLRFGPLQAENRFERLFFWPDPRGVILRQVQELLAGKDEAALEPGALAAKSVAVQGLPALEYVLHGSGSEELAQAGGGYRCRYGAAVAANVAAIAQAVEAGWQDDSAFSDDFTAPSGSNDLYRSNREVAAEVVKAAGTALQFVRNAQLLPALGETAEAARGRRAPLWRSDLTFALAAAQIGSVSDIAGVAGFDLDPQARKAVEALRFDIGHARAALGAIEQPAEHAFADENDRPRIRYVTVALEAANATLGNALSAALGLTMGFNALDGD